MDASYTSENFSVKHGNVLFNIKPELPFLTKVWFIWFNRFSDAVENFQSMTVYRWWNMLPNVP